MALVLKIRRLLQICPRHSRLSSTNAGSGGGSGGSITFAHSMNVSGEGPAKVRMVKHGPTLKSLKVASEAGTHKGAQQLGLVDGGATRHALR